MGGLLFASGLDIVAWREGMTKPEESDFKHYCNLIVIDTKEGRVVSPRVLLQDAFKRSPQNYHNAFTYVPEEVLDGLLS